MRRSSNHHYGDLIKWVESVIMSCTTPKHVNSASKLIDFLTTHSAMKSLDFKLHRDVITELRVLLLDQEIDIIRQSTNQR